MRPEAASAWREAGGTVCATLSEMSQAAECVVLAVFDSKDVLGVLEAQSGLLARLLVRIDGLKSERVGPTTLSERAQEKEAGAADEAEREAARRELEFAELYSAHDRILAESGSGLDRLVKTTVFLANLGDFQGMNSVYSKHVGDQPPARSTFEVAALPSAALVEIEAIAHL